jgi:hypothetical protein
MIEVRKDMAKALAEAWSQIGHCGTWWTGAERVAIAAETRRAATCAFCSARRAALSPATVSGAHDACSSLPPAAVEAIHRISTDSGRLGAGWYERLLDDGLSDLCCHFPDRLSASRRGAGRSVLSPVLPGCPPWPPRTARRRTPISTKTIRGHASEVAAMFIAPSASSPGP